MGRYSSVSVNTTYLLVWAERNLSPFLTLWRVDEQCPQCPVARVKQLLYVFNLIYIVGFVLGYGRMEYIAGSTVRNIIWSSHLTTPYRTAYIVLLLIVANPE